jgi:soluble lytic murein transglycosylase-like protein
MSKRGKIILWLIVSLILGMLSMNMYLNLNEKEVTINQSKVTEVKYKPYLQREEINGVIKSMTDQGQNSQILAVYSSIAGDSTLAHIIISYALKYDIPVSLLFGLIGVESEFDPQALNKNPNGTYDYGLMSLNSNTFKSYSRKQLYEIDTNLKLGCEFLLILKKRYRTWGEAVIHYNGLYTKGAGSYMVKVLEREREYERLFNEMI